MRKSNSIIRVDIDTEQWTFIENLESLSSMTGYGIEELVMLFDNGFLNMLPYDESVFIKEQILDQLSTNLYAEMDFVLPCADNFSMWVHIQAEQDENKDGNIIQIWLNNTTQYHETTEELLKRLVEFENTLQGGVWCASCDSELSILWCNDKYIDIIGLESYSKSTEDSLKSKAVFFIHPDDILFVMDSINKAINEKKVELSLEYRVKRADTKIISVFTSIKFNYSHESALPVIYCISYDVSDLNHRKDSQRLMNLYKYVIQKNATCVCEYDINTKTIHGTSGLQKLFNQYDNFPQSAIENGVVSQECKENFLNIFDTESSVGINSPVAIHLITDVGNNIWVNITRSICYNENGLPIKIIALVEDVSIKHNKDFVLLEAKYYAINPSYNGIFSCSINLTKNYIIQVSDEFFNSFGFKSQHALTDALSAISSQFVHPDDVVLLNKAFDADDITLNLKSGISSSEHELREKFVGGKYGWIRLTFNYSLDPDTEDILIYVHRKDIQQQKEHEIKLRLQAERDALTQLYNRITLEAKVDKALSNSSSSGRHALFMIDLDNFKYVNDSYGHVYGDDVLIRVAEKLREVFAFPHMVGRIGGDEFTALACDVTHPEAVRMAENICAALQSTLSDTCVVSASVGIAFSPNDGEQFNTLYHCADMALYEAKRKGKNCYSIYSKSMHSYTNEEKVSISREWLLDVSSDIVYVSDFYTYDLLYMNNGARDLFNIRDDYRGKKCYEVLQNREKPCTFCTNKYLSRDTFYRWEHYNDVLNKYLWLKDRIVDWYGVSARIEFATDVTEQEFATRALEKKINIDNILVKSLCEMSNTHSVDIASERLLEHVGTFYRADRICVYEYNNDVDCASMIREWVNLDVKPMISASRYVSNNVFAPMQKCFFNDKNYILKDLSIIEFNHIELHSLLKMHNTQEIYAVPFLISNRNAGIVTLENPRDFVNDLSTLETLAFFISEQKVKTQLSNRIVYLQEHDMLTNLLNRAKYNEYKSDLIGRELSSLGIMIANINDMKNINVTLGYDYGDRVVCDVADCIDKTFPISGKYRLDGDEFVVVWENVLLEEFEKHIQKLQTDFRGSGDTKIAVGYSWTQTHVTIDDLFNQANDMMSIDKQLDKH